MSTSKQTHFQTDALNPSALPSASGSRRPQSSTSRLLADVEGFDDPGERYQAALKKNHDDWNVRIDKEVKGVADGLKEFVNVADLVPNPSSSTSSLQLQLQLQLSQLIRSTQNIRDMTHQLKLQLMLSDNTATVQKRDKEVNLLREEISKRREDVGKEMSRFCGGDPDARQLSTVNPVEVEKEDIGTTQSRQDGMHGMEGSDGQSQPQPEPGGGAGPGSSASRPEETPSEVTGPGHTEQEESQTQVSAGQGHGDDEEDEDMEEV